VLPLADDYLRGGDGGDATTARAITHAYPRGLVPLPVVVSHPACVLQVVCVENNIELLGLGEEEVHGQQLVEHKARGFRVDPTAVQTTLPPFQAGDAVLVCWGAQFIAVKRVMITAATRGSSTSALIGLVRSRVDAGRCVSLPAQLWVLQAGAP
jgi:hypothetical protein